MTASLILPTVLSAVALFVASFLSWVVMRLHAKDWRKLPREDDFLEAIRQLKPERGNYMFPCAETAEEMKSEEHTKKWKAGPCGILTVFPQVNMGRNLGLTFVHFLVVSFCIGYLASLALAPGAEFRVVFRFVSTAGVLTFLAAIVQHAIWFHNRIVGHIIDAIVQAAILGAIFAALWPAA